MGLRTRGLPSHPFFGYGLLIGLLGAVYWATLLPGVGYSGDTAKFQFIGKVLGTPHATGYPTYVVLNHLFVTLFPFGSLAFKANALSALFSIAATLVLFRILLALDVSGFIAFISALTFGLTRTLWLQSVVAEVYTLHLLYVALVLYFFIRWAQTKQDRHFYTATAIYALSFGNHLTTVTLLPAIVYLVWATDRRVFLDRKKLLWVGGFVMLSALQYTYIFWRVRDPTTPYLEMRPANLQEFAWYMTGARFQAKMFVFSLTELLTQRLPMFLDLLWKQFWLLLPLAIYGLVRFRNRTLNIFLFLCFLANAFYAINYDI